MDSSGFWRLIADSRAAIDPQRADGNQARQSAALEAALKQLPPPEILAFRDQLWSQMVAAYRWDLWAVAHILGRGCSEDGFQDFRSWLVSLGREGFEAALQDPDGLWRVARESSVEDVFFERLQYVPQIVYRALTGSEIPPPPQRHPKSPVGVRWRDEQDLQRLLPKTWAATRG